MTLTQIAMLTLYAVGLSLGQLLFKTSAQHMGTTATLTERAASLLVYPPFILALGLYFALTLLWVWILSFTPLSRAYPFVAVAFALTPVLANFVFAEPLSARTLAGVAAIFVGLVLVAG